MLTNEELDMICQRAEAATPGPWLASGMKHYVMPSHGEAYKVAQLGGTAEHPGVIARDDSHLPHDTEFIAHAREDIPALLSYVARLRKALVRVADMTALEREADLDDFVRGVLSVFK